MNDRGFVASPLDNGNEPVDFAPDKISINKPDDNALMNNSRRLIFFCHDCLLVTNHGFGKRPTR